MGNSDAPHPPRARNKASDFSELFRSGHGSRHSSRTGAGTGPNPSSAPSLGEKSAGTKAASRRSMLPFLGRKKAAEQTAVPPMPTSRKSVGNTSYPITPVNTVRRSFGNGHAVLMITPASHSPTEPPPLPTKLPSAMDVHSSTLGSKLAAHFTPLRSPKSSKASPAIQKPAAPVPPVPSPSALSPPVLERRAPSIESQHSSTQSRSTTPRPLRGPYSPTVENGDEEDFSDLFTLPDPLKKPQHPPMSSSSTSVHIYHGDSPKKSGELTPATPVTPLGPPLQFPIPPLTVGPPRPIGIPRYSSELSSLSSQGSRSPSKLPSPVVVDAGGGRTHYADCPSPQDERKGGRHRSTSISGSDTDTSRANDSTYPSFKLAPVKPSSMKTKASASSTAKASCGPPPSLPLPSPPLSANTGGLGPRSAPNGSPNRVAFPRPRANTLSVTSNLVVPVHVAPKSNHSSPTRSNRVNSNVAPDATVDELRVSLSHQLRKNAQLQEYIVTITKRYEDDRMAMTRTIEKLERNVRKKMREIEGLRWLVIHNGAVSDIDAAANLARASFSTQEGDTFDGAIGSPPSLPSSPVVPPHLPRALSHQSVSGQKGAGVTVTAATTSPDVRSDASSSVVSFSTSSVSEATSLTTPSLSVIPERMDGISRAERQRLKEERRASKALRRISAASTFAVLGPDPQTQSPTADDALDPNFDPKQGMDEVLEKLQPFRHT